MKIEFKKVCKKYNEKYVLKDISIGIEGNSFITVLGASGCGKTTFLKMINQLENISCGELLIDNKNINDYDTIKLRRKIGYAIQNAVLFPHLTVLENICYVPSLFSKHEKKEININIERLLSIIKLDKNLLNRYPDEISGGQQQRVAIGRAIAANPDILLMDEPFSALDEITREQLQNEVKQIHNEMNLTTIFVTHDVKEALSLGSKVLVLNNGIVEAYDTPQNILNSDSEYVKKLLSINIT